MLPATTVTVQPKLELFWAALLIVNFIPTFTLANGLVPPVATIVLSVLNVKFVTSGPLATIIGGLKLLLFFYVTLILCGIDSVPEPAKLTSTLEPTLPPHAVSGVSVTLILILLPSNPTTGCLT